MAEVPTGIGEAPKPPRTTRVKEAVIAAPGKSRKRFTKHAHFFKNEKGISEEELKSLRPATREHLLLDEKSLARIEEPLRRPFIETQLVGVNVLRNTTRQFESLSDSTAGGDRAQLVGRQVNQLFQAEERKVNFSGRFTDRLEKNPQPIELNAGQTTAPDGSTVSGLKIAQPDGSTFIAQQILGRDGDSFLCQVIGEKEPVKILMSDVLRSQIIQESSALSSLMSGEKQAIFDTYTGALRDITTDTNPQKSSPTLHSAIGADRRGFDTRLISVADSEGMITRQDYVDAANKISGYSTDTEPDPTDAEAHAKWDHRQRLMRHLKPNTNILDGATVRVVLEEQFDRMRTHAQNERANATDVNRKEKEDHLTSLDEIGKNRELLVSNFDAVQAGAIYPEDLRIARQAFADADVREGPQKLMDLVQQNLVLGKQVDQENQLRGTRVKKTYKTMATILLLLAGASYMIFNKGMGAGEERGYQ